MIPQHPQVVKYTVEDDCLYVYIDGEPKKQLVPKMLLQVSIRELYSIMIIPPE